MNEQGAAGAASSLVVLVGYRCTGKTTVAAHLARLLRWNWTDMDPLLEARTGRTVREIFESEGEAGFRARESVLLNEVCGLQRHVLATGGGVVLLPRNRECLQKAGTVFWLKADALTIHQRMTGDPTTTQRRPALTVGGLAEIEDLLTKREPLYRECAHGTVDTVDHTPEEVAANIMEWLSRNRPI
jgi:shikimate kinase